MRRTTTIVVAVILGAASVAQAQTPANPLSTNFKTSWTNISSLLARMAEKMPEADYGFKPTPEMQDFGQRMAHVIGFNMRQCGASKGEQAADVLRGATKAEFWRQ